MVVHDDWMATDSLKEIEPSLFNVSRETLSYRSYNSQIHIIVGDTFMDIKRIIPHMAIKLRRIVMIQFSAVT